MRFQNLFPRLRRQQRASSSRTHGVIATSRSHVFRAHLWFIANAADTWWPEALAMSLSMFCSVAIGITLQSFSDMPVPNLPNDLTLNAIISLLATISKSAMLFIVGSCLAQMKWVYFREEQSLIQLQIMEDASRGPLGAFWLFCNRLMGPLAVLGAVITLLSLAFDPFVQLVVLYSSRTILVPSPGSIFKQSLGVWESTFTNLDVDFMRTVNNALWSSDFDLKPTCLAKNCTWGLVESVGWYHRCRKVKASVTEPCNIYPNVSDLASPPDKRFDYERQCSFNVTGFGTQSFNFTGFGSNTRFNTNVPLSLVKSSKGPRRWGSQSNESETVIDLPTDALLAVIFTNLNYDTDGNLRINESEVCTLDLCLREYNVSVRNGIANVNQTNILYGTKWRTNFSDGVATDPVYQTTLGCRLNRTQFDSTPQNFSAESPLPTFLDGCGNSTIDRLACWSPGKTTGLTFKDRWQIYSWGNPNDSRETIFYDEDSHAFCKIAASATPLSWTQQTLPNRLNGYAYLKFKIDCDAEDFPCTNRSVVLTQKRAALENDLVSTYFQGDGPLRAKALTPEVFMRNFAASLTKLAWDKSWVNVTGQIMTEESFVQVRWVWLILPASLNLLSALLLSLTAYQTRQHQVPLWRSSTMALLFHGLSDNITVPEHLHRVSDMDEHAETVRVRMRFSNKVNRIILEPKISNISAPVLIQSTVLQAPTPSSGVVTDDSPTLPVHSPSLTASARSSTVSGYSYRSTPHPHG